MDAKRPPVAFKAGYHPPKPVIPFVFTPGNPGTKGKGMTWVEKEKPSHGTGPAAGQPSGGSYAAVSSDAERDCLRWIQSLYASASKALSAELWYIGTSRSSS